MSDRRARVVWLPPLMVGAAAAVAAEVAMGMLLFSGPGFVRSLTVILGVEGTAFAVGLWTAPAAGPELVDRLRIRWVVCMLAYLAAGVYGTAWSVFPWFGEGALGQGVGLAILAGFPLYTAGTVLGGLSVAVHSDTGGHRNGQAAPAVLGAALGFVLTGTLLPRAPIPASLIIAALVMLSFGGMVFGRVLGSLLQVRVLSSRASAGSEVRVEERILSTDEMASRLLLEGGRVRREAALRSNGAAPWDVAVVRAFMPPHTGAWRVLLVGGGASSAPRTVLREHPTAVVDVLERTGAVVELGRAHFDTDLTIARGERVGVEVGNLDDLMDRVTASYDLVVVDTDALAPIGGVGGLSLVTRARLWKVTHAHGVMAWGPLAGEPGVPEVPGGWSQAEFSRGRSGRADEHVILARMTDSVGWPPDFDGFKPSEVESPAVPETVTIGETAGQ